MNEPTMPPDPGYTFRQRPLRWLFFNWRLRHQHPFNFWIHMLGIPCALVGVVLVFVLPWEQWYWGAGAFVLGYVLQFIGHKVEGNDVGEFIPFKKMLGLPYVEIAPRWQREPTQDQVRP